MLPTAAELNKERDRIKVVFQYHKNNVKAIRSVPGARFYGPEKGGPYWLVPLDLTTAHRLREAFGEYLELGSGLKKWGHRQVRKEEQMLELASAKTAKLKNLPKKLPKLSKALRPYQRAGVAKMATADQLNADEPGLGKTIETIAAVYECEGDLDKGRMLVIAPKTSLETVWLQELDRWLPEDIPVFTMSGDDPPGERKEILDEIEELCDHNEPFWLITTAAAVRYEVDKAATKANKEAGIVDHKGRVRKVYRPAHPRLFEVEWTVVVWDEYHKMGLSNPQRDYDGSPVTQIGKAAFDLIVEGRKYPLSGTPMGGKPIKLWAILNYLDPGRFTSMWRWIDEWLETETRVIGKEVDAEGNERDKTATSYYGVRKGLEEQFNRHITPYVIRRTKKEVAPDLPDKQFVHLAVDMTPKQAKQYKKMAMDAEVKIAEFNLSANNILTEYLRLKQFADAHQTISIKKVKKTDERTGDSSMEDKMMLKATEDSGKLAMIMELLNERGIYPSADKKGDEGMVDEGDDQIIIGTQFTDIARMIHEWLTRQGISAEIMTGKATQQQRTDMVRHFQSDDPNRPRILVMTTQTGGVSITLDNADTAIIVDETWDPDDQSQFSDRGWGRYLQDVTDPRNKMTVYFIRSKDTIEQYIWEKTQGKQMTNDMILDLRRKGFRAVMSDEDLEAVAA